jgi:hypothetical protein
VCVAVVPAASSRKSASSTVWACERERARERERGSRREGEGEGEGEES